MKRHFHMDIPVLVIGAGPVGLITALSLAEQGVQSLIVERRTQRYGAPKAHAVNARTLEICERLGVSADHIRAEGASIEEGGLVHFMDVLNGQCFGALPYERQDDAVRAFTPFPLTNIAQPKFEDALLAALPDREAITLRRGATVVELTPHDDGVEATIAQDDEEYIVRAQYVVAADGAGSRTRTALGIDMHGPEALQSYMMIHFEADLRALTSQHPGLLYFTLSPAHSGVFIGYDRGRTWVFMQSYDPNTQTIDDFGDARCRELIEAAAGAALPDLTIQNISPWTMSAQVAERYRADRVFLAGDAAHRFPPTGGLGLNTGAGDAQNIAWKLAQVLAGTAGDGLLDSYEGERKPVAELNSEQSLTNSAKMLHLFGALYGSDPAAQAERYAKACRDPSQLPEIAAAVEIQRPHFDSLNLQIGYRYGAAVDPATLDISDYQPSYEPGSYLPHVATSDGTWLLGQLPGNAFSLVAGEQGDAWSKLDLPVAVAGRDFQPEQPWHKAADLNPDGALLIRPDGHIAARWESLPDNPEHAVNAALQQLLEA